MIQLQDVAHPLSYPFDSLGNLLHVEPPAQLNVVGEKAQTDLSAVTDPNGSV